jgi:hypothetical protein
MERPMQKLNDLRRSLTPLEPDGTLIAVIEMSQSSWLVAGIVPGVERQPLKKLEVDESALLKLLNRWREEAKKVGHRIERIAVAFEAGRDGFWLARWLRARDIEAHVIHASSAAVSREHRRAKTDRLDTELPPRDPPSEKNIERVSQSFARFFRKTSSSVRPVQDLKPFTIFDVQTEKQARKRSPRLVAFMSSCGTASKKFVLSTSTTSSIIFCPILLSEVLPANSASSMVAG